MRSILVIAEEANPEWVSVPLVGWSHSRALARVADVHTVTQIRNEPSFRRAGLDDTDFTAVDSERLARPLYRAATALRGGAGKGWTVVTAVAGLSYYYFERELWRRFGARIKKREFDVVHRITPLSPTVPSLLAAKCSVAGVPFVLGPLNGGVPWPRGFDSARRKEREWLSYVRSTYKLLPGYASTRRHASAIICGSKDTLSQVPERYQSKCVYIPENAIDPARFPAREPRGVALPLRVAFVGRLVPYKGVDMLIEAAADLVRSGRIVLDVIGDGPEMPALRDLIRRERLESGVQIAGWLEHSAVKDRLGAADLLGFPSIREFGGGVVLEAMALGVVPIVVGYGGPAELVTPETGFAVPIGSRAKIIADFRAILERLVDHPEVIGPMQRRAQQRVCRLFTWDAKALQVLQVYEWVLGQRRDKPDFGMPLIERPELRSELCQAEG